LIPQLLFDSSHSLPRNGPHIVMVSIVRYFTYRN